MRVETKVFPTLTLLQFPITFTELFIRKLNPHREESDIFDITWISESYKDWENTWFTESNNIDKRLFDFVEVRDSMKEFIEGRFV